MGKSIVTCWLLSALTLTPRLGIEYAPNILNDIERSFPPYLQPGRRAPDAHVRRNGFPRQPVRVFDVAKNDGKFHLMIFTGDVHNTRGLLRALRKNVDKSARPFAHAMSFRTIVLGHGVAFQEYLGIEQFGDAYWDPDHSAHNTYKASLESGQIVVLRPDGILGLVAPLDGFDGVVRYLDRLIVARGSNKTTTNGVNGNVGKLINLDENNLYYQQAKDQARQQDLPESTESGVIRAH